MAFIDELHIGKFRGIQGLNLMNLKQVNLIVGDNNCGKTSVLEAIQLLRTSGNLANIYRVSRLRETLSISNANSIFDSFICMFPKDSDTELQLSVTGNLNGKEAAFKLNGIRERILLDPKELDSGRYKSADIPEGEAEVDSFTGHISTTYGEMQRNQSISINQYSSITGTPSSDKDLMNIVYVSPYEHLRGSIIDRVLRNETYKQVCIKALQLFDPDIEDLMIFRSDIGNRPVEYIRHRRLGDMPVSTYGDGLKRVLMISNEIAQAAEGILLFDEIETSIHKKYYDDIFRFTVKACKSFNVQVFITTHSIEAIDGILATQDYDRQQDEDDICVCTLKREENTTYSRILTGRDVFENRNEFGFEVRL